jgi:MoxR-like ATPase
MNLEEANQRVRDQRSLLDPLYTEVERVIVGQRKLLDRLLMGLFAGGHVLLEGVPGLAKTLMVRTLASALHLPFSRIQFTPDLLPADVVGTQIYQPRTGEFSVKRGPVFASLVLADEINRAPAKVQSALLESMQERQVTIGDQTFLLPEPFMVLATQNPIEQEGTYPLPEAQVDRFMMKLRLDYPQPDEELAILDRMAHVAPATKVQAVLSADQLRTLSAAVEAIHMDDKIKRYIVDLVQATRRPADFHLPLERYIHYGASPRGTIALALVSKAHAFLEGRCFVTPHDVKSVGYDVLRHRVLITYEAEADELTPDKLLKEVFDHVKVP